MPREETENPENTALYKQFGNWHESCKGNNCYRFGRITER